MLDKSMPARKQGTRGAVGERGERVRRGVEKREREREREREKLLQLEKNQAKRRMDLKRVGGGRVDGQKVDT